MLLCGMRRRLFASDTVALEERAQNVEQHAAAIRILMAERVKPCEIWRTMVAR